MKTTSGWAAFFLIGVVAGILVERHMLGPTLPSPPAAPSPPGEGIASATNAGSSSEPTRNATVASTSPPPPLAQTQQTTSWTDIEEALREAAPLPPAQQAERLAALANAVATNDLAATIDRLTQTSTPVAEQLFQILVRRWGETAPSAAADWLVGRPATAQRNNLLAEVLKVWIRKDPRESLQWSKRLPAGTWRNRLRVELLQHWAEADPQATASALLSEPLPVQIEVAPTLTTAWALREPTAALAWTEQLPEGTLRLAAFQRVVRGWTQRDPAAAAHAIQRFPEPARPMAIRVIAAAWAQQDAPSAWAWAADLPRDAAGPIARAAVIRVWAQQDPQNAAAAALAMGEPIEKNLAVQVVARTWAELRLQEAVSWLQQLPQQAWRWVAFEAMAGEWAAADARAALQMAETAPAGSQRDKFIGVILGTWLGTEPRAAREWTEARLTRGADASWWPEAAARWTRLAPLEAVAFARDMATRHSTQHTRQAWTRSLQRWAAHDGAAAASWLVRQPEGAAQDEPWTALMQAWIAQVGEDTAPIELWLLTLQPGPAADRAKAAYIQTILDAEPQQAVQWAERLADPDVRTRWIEAATREWLKQEPAAARAWLQQADLPAALRDKLMSAGD